MLQAPSGSTILRAPCRRCDWQQRFTLKTFAGVGTHPIEGLARHELILLIPLMSGSASLRNLPSMSSPMEYPGPPSSAPRPCHPPHARTPRACRPARDNQPCTGRTAPGKQNTQGKAKDCETFHPSDEGIHSSTLRNLMALADFFRSPKRASRKGTKHT